MILIMRLQIQDKNPHELVLLRGEKCPRFNLPNTVFCNPKCTWVVVVMVGKGTQISKDTPFFQTFTPGSMFSENSYLCSKDLLPSEVCEPRREKLKTYFKHGTYSLISNNAIYECTVNLSPQNDSSCRSHQVVRLLSFATCLAAPPCLGPG